MRIIALCTVVAIMTTLAAGTTDTEQPGQTMRAVRIKEFGPPEALRIERVQRPTPGQGELLVRVHAAAVTPRWMVSTRIGNVAWPLGREKSTQRHPSSC